MDISFSDILIEDQFSDVGSRDVDVDISSNVGGLLLNLPLFSSNMPQITEWKMAVEMVNHGGMGILHRFQDIESNVQEYRKAIEEVCIKLRSCSQNISHLVGVSIGIKDDGKERFDALYEEGARTFCIDIAHGHCTQMKDMVGWISNKAKDVIIIAGNIATARAALDFAEWGVNVAKVGIGPGSVCKTRSNAGVGTAQFTAIKNVYDALHGISSMGILADGGIRSGGDFAKAMIYSDAVMVGAVLAGTSETPGRAFAEPGTDLTNRTWYKMYGGNASGENKDASGKSVKFVEGEMLKIPFKGHAKYMLREMKEGLQSAMSYSGSRTLSEYKKKVKWRLISGSSSIESKYAG